MAVKTLQTVQTWWRGRGLPLVPAVAWTLLCGVTQAASSPGTALDAYQRGNYRSSEAQYSQLARQKPDDARLRFNAGAAAYKNNDLTNAATWFESTTAAPDLDLQQQAYYNLGNTRYRLGEAAQDPQQRMKEWEQSLQHYGSALKLNAGDTNAVANRALVQRALEQLKQQMPKQQQQGKDGDQKDNKDQQQGQSGQQQQDQQDQNQKQNQQGQQQQQQDKQNQQAKSDPQNDSQNKESGSQNQGEESDEDKQQQQAQQGQEKDSEAKKQQAQAAKQDKGSQEGGQQAGQGEESFAEQQGKPGEMSAVQAERLLDQQKGEEKALIFRAAGSGKEASQRQRRNMKQW